MLIKRFGENDEQKWYELSDGKRISCDEYGIDILWQKWVSSENSKRADNDEFTIFEFIEPVEINL